MDTAPLHPYYPRTLELGHYVPNRIPMMTLLGIVGSVLIAIVAMAFLSARHLKNRSASDAGRFAWFIMCALMHCLFEGYWLSHHDTIAGQSDILAELWKEYAYSDSRYVSSDVVLVALETITIFIWGPMCMLAGISIWNGSPNQYIWQLLASMAHLFSTTMYFALDLPSGFANCIPHPLYFWLYFVSFNAPFLIIPAAFVVQSYKRISNALATTHVKKNM